MVRVLFDLNNAEYFGHGEHMISLFDYVSMFLVGRKTLQTSENDVIYGLVYWKKNLVHDMKMVKGNNNYCQQYCKVIKVFFSAFALVVVVVSYFRVVLL